MDWADEPATEQQVSQLVRLGFHMARPLSLTEAASLIRQYKKQASRRNTTPASGGTGWPVRGASAPLSFSTPPKEGWPDPGRRMLHISEEPHAPLGAAVPPPRPIESPANEAIAEETERLEFWLDTFRDVKEMQVASVKVYELRQKHGCHFLLPRREQVEDVLKALDTAIPAWDRDHPEFFYQTLELNFPELAR